MKEDFWAQREEFDCYRGLQSEKSKLVEESVLFKEVYRRQTAM